MAPKGLWRSHESMVCLLGQMVRKEWQGYQHQPPKPLRQSGNPSRGFRTNSGESSLCPDRQHDSSGLSYKEE